MKSGINISRVWSDDDVVELRILVSDGASSFSNKVYVGHSALEDAVSSLQVFKDHVHGGLLDLRFVIVRRTPWLRGDLAQWKRGGSCGGLQGVVAVGPRPGRQGPPLLLQEFDGWFPILL